MNGKLEELHRNKIVVSSYISDGATWDANWAFLYFDQWRWRAELRKGSIDLDSLGLGALILDRPVMFENTEAYRKWLQASCIFVDPSMREYIDKGRTGAEFFYVRAAYRTIPCPFPGGYWSVDCLDYSSHPIYRSNGPRYSIIVCDADDAVYSLSTDDAETFCEAKEVLRSIPDLTARDFAELGLR